MDYTKFLLIYIFVTSIRSDVYETDELSCIYCYTDDKIQCVNNDFLTGYCCDYEENSVELEECIQNYDYCSNDLGDDDYSAVYQAFTCP